MIVRTLGTVVMLIGLAASSFACSKSATTPTTVSSVAVSGTAPALGATSQFTAMATMSDGTTQDVTSQATWTSTNAADATVSSTGLVTGVTAGSVAIQATYQSVTGTDLIAIGS